MTDNNTPTTNNIQDDTVMVHPATKKTIWNNIFLVVAIVLGLYTMVVVATGVSGEEIHTFKAIIQYIDWSILLPAIAVLVIGMMIDVMKYQLVCNTVVGKARLRTSIKVAIVGKYYDNVTPFHTGGQPMQMIYLHKKGYSVGDASAIITAKYLANTMAWLVVGVVLLCNVGALATLDSTVRILLIVCACIGVVVHLSIPVLMVLFVIAPGFTKKLIAVVVGIGYKLRLTKDKQASCDKWIQLVEQYKASLKTLSQYRFKAILLFIMCLAEPIIVYAMPYVLMLALPCGIELSNSMLITVMSINAFAGFSVMIVPTPGNSGVIEWVTSLAFASIASGVLFWVVFLWRFMMYYIYILGGLGLTIHELIRNKIRTNKSKKNT